MCYLQFYLFKLPTAAERKRRVEEAQQSSMANGTGAESNGGTAVSLLFLNSV